MKNICGQEMPLNPYHKNPTMKLLGHQCALEPFWYNDEVKKQIEEISEGRPFSFTLEVASDIFMLGYIHGKRAERARRKKRTT